MAKLYRQHVLGEKEPEGFVPLGTLIKTNGNGHANGNGNGNGTHAHEPEREEVLGD
jgi:hypothetical protein